ncbi:hypothetical protein A2771_03955 [Candidatus Woesebacteria bacterium RIFCSPHIGHO2_01_FULL_38_26b]|uniref:Uncharacterized protein n=1 Tax=Candidatus Woesebacteria bacterium RIFCSPHIGHO2_01_FULL_38_26b TaxID=1802491 RepID=A0A1F7XW32_9BACT|nr:MAG: hypothetical protein A2771_03955 [Candidatus Woesebacteria bacterium RIFCSPHIGHO2_01_FULL_38_26b]
MQRPKESASEARKYWEQLVNPLFCCHSKNAAAFLLSYLQYQIFGLQFVDIFLCRRQLYHVSPLHEATGNEARALKLRHGQVARQQTLPYVPSFPKFLSSAHTQEKLRHYPKFCKK